MEMEEEGAESGFYAYLQDDLGSPMHLLNEDGKIRESYGYDEFGMELFSEENRGGRIQPFGYTGYQMEEAGGVYYAQARRYDAGAGRFISEDKIKGFTSMPYTLNQYSYCWNRPLDYVDLDGKFPWLIIPVVIGAVMLTGCTAEETKGPPKDYYQDDSVGQNCYSYVFQLPAATRPGMISYTGNNGYTNQENRIYTVEEIAEYVLRDMETLGKNVRIINNIMEASDNEYVVSMKTSTERVPVEGYRNVADFHFAILLSDGTWADKTGQVPSRWNVLDGTDLTWDWGYPENEYYVKGYYNTESIFFAVEVCPE